MDTIKNLKEIFSENSDGKIVLPNFQRGFIWKVTEQKKLLSTVLSLLPIGSLLLLQGKKGDFATRQLCFTAGDFEQSEECLYLLDGQQRTSTLRAIFSDLLGSNEEWESNYNHLYKDLRYRWFINVQKTDDEDLFGYENLKFKKITNYEPGQFMDNIVVIKITKQNRSEWYHPDFSGNKGETPLKGHMLELEVAKRAAEQGLIPLYKIYNMVNENDNNLLNYTLDQLVYEKLKFLKAAVSDGDKSINDILGHRVPNIDELVKNNEEDQIAYLWNGLGTTWKNDILNYFKEILELDMHTIQLKAGEISRATSIYESINKGGVSLNTYDLIVAKAAKTMREEITLTEKIIMQLNEEIELSDALLDPVIGQRNKFWSSKNMKTVEDNKIANPIRDQFLNLLSIFSHLEYGNVDELKIDLIKKDKQLSIAPDQIHANQMKTIKALIRASSFLQYRCGKTDINDVNYKLMLLPIAYILESDNNWNSKAAIAKLEYWYWTSLFGGSYREKQNQRCIRDIIELQKWILGGDNPFESRHSSVLNLEGYSSLNVLLNKDEENGIPLAIHNGLMEYVLSSQPRDFYPDNNIFLNAWEIAEGKEIKYNDEVTRNLKVEDHHIYPLGADLSIGQSSRDIRSCRKHILNSPLNRTYISDYANSLIRDKSPSRYFSLLTNVTTWRHYIESLVWEKVAGETDQECYERLLTSRFNKIREGILMELDLLKEVCDS